MVSCELGGMATRKVGDEGFDFELRTSLPGRTFRLSEWRGKNAVVINFLPAAFWPVCSTQLPMIEEVRSQFEGQKAILGVISIDNVWLL